VPARWNEFSFVGLSEYNAVFVLWCTLAIFSLNKSHLFSTDRRLLIVQESWKVFRALLLAGVLTLAVVFMLKFHAFSRLVFALSWISGCLFLIVWRVCKRIVIRYRIKKQIGMIKVLIVGSGPVAESIIKELKNHSFLGFEVVGMLSQERIVDESIYGCKVIGSYNDIETVVQKYFIDEVFVTSLLSHAEFESFVLAGSKLGCGIKIVPEGFDHIYGSFSTYHLGYIHFLEYGMKKLHGTELFIKRFFDLAVSCSLLTILSPFFIVFALLVKLYDGGPVFYVSQRVGKKGKVFNFYKFRSMKVGADKLKEELREQSEVAGPIFKIKRDPRITKVGAFLRKYSIDELPQLWNVAKGDMSLVGPRPPTLDEVEKYDLWQMRRLEVRPGITCLWQVRGRSNLSFYKWVKWDLWYIDNWSFWLDIRILSWTVPAVIRGEGAY
jgi:exopolysaccharide biosynthesis polyprenyl glycosylphosphotransferase